MEFKRITSLSKGSVKMVAQIVNGMKAERQGQILVTRNLSKATFRYQLLSKLMAYQNYMALKIKRSIH